MFNFFRFRLAGQRPLLLAALLLTLLPAHRAAAQNPPIQIAFLWHMHQPVYWPGESVNQTITANRYPFSVRC